MRVMICEDDALFRDALAALLEHRGFGITGRAGDLEELDALLARGVPDVVILDIGLPPTRTDEGIRGAAELRRAHPSLGILVLSQFAATSYAERLLALGGGIGYLLKDAGEDASTFCDALRRVGRSESVIDPSLVRRLVDRRQTQSRISTLTSQERKVLSLMAEGRSNAGIAAIMHLSDKTVESYITSIQRKLELHVASDDNRRVLAVLEWIQARAD